MVWANEYMHTDEVADLLHKTEQRLTEDLHKAADEIDKWRKIADDFATAHRNQHGLGGAWDTVNAAYDQAVKEANLAGEPE